MTTRIPSKAITGLYGTVVKKFSAKMFGRVPESLGVMWHHLPALKAGMGLGQKLAEVGRLRREPQVVRAHGCRRADRLQLVPGLQLLHGPQRGPRRGQGTGGAALARVDGVHAAGARRAWSTPRR